MITSGPRVVGRIRSHPPHFESKCQFNSKLLIFSNFKIKMGESFLAEPEIENSNQVTPRKNVSIVDSRWTKEPGLP